MKSARSTAARIVAQWLRTRRMLDELLEEEIPNRAFVMEIVYGVARWKRLLEWILRRVSVGRADPDLVPYALVGIYQILFMDTVKAYAAVSETVEASKEVGGKRSAGFINRVLRQTVRERVRLRREIESQPIGIRESHPDALVKRWIRVYGEERTQALCRWNNRRADVIVRVNTLKTTLAELLSRWSVVDVHATPHPFAPDTFAVVARGGSPRAFSGYDEGLFSVQDPSASCAVALMDPRPGEVVLDACAAPGGKTILIAEHMEDKGRIVTLDVHSKRLRLLTENVRRMGLRSVEAAQADASSAELLGVLRERSFDRILLDVPCTNTGVLRRRPDARWRFSMERLTDLNRLQLSLLENVAPLLKPGGTLVYSTCSLEPEENESLVRSWLASHPKFFLMRSTFLFPPETQTDGIYAAAIGREN